MDVYEYYWDAVRRRAALLVLGSGVLALLAYGVAVRIGPTYEVHFSYLVSLTERDSSKSEFRFDGYYALQATDLYAATLAAWTRTPEVVVQAYGAAGLALPTDDPRTLVRSIAAQKVSPQLVAVTVSGKRKDTVEKLAAGLQAVMEQNVAAYHDRGIPALEFRIVPTAAWVGTRQVAVVVIVVATYLAALILGVNAVLLRASWQQASPNMQGAGPNRQGADGKSTDEDRD